jgi:hypothetical protein
MSYWTPPLKVKLQKFETAHGLMLRLCERNGVANMRQFQNATGLKMPHVLAGRHLDRLAEMLNIPVAELEAASFQVQSLKPIVVRGEHLRKFDLTRIYRRVCLFCLEESMHQQFWWDLAFVTHCPHHEAELVGRCTCGNKLSWKDREIGCCFRCRFEHLDTRRALRETREFRFQRWALGRLGVLDHSGHVPMLDKVSLKDAIDIATKVGQLATKGWSKQGLSSQHSTPENIESREVGFSYIKKQKLPELFDRVHTQAESALGTSPTSMFESLGYFWWWFSHAGGKTFSPELSALLTQHFSNRFHTIPTRVKRIVPPRSLLGLRELSERTGVGKEIIRAILLNRGHMVASKRAGSPIITTEGAAWVIDNLSDKVNTREAKRILGVQGRPWEVLVEQNWIPILQEPMPTARSRGSWTNRIFRRQSLTDWLDELVPEVPEFDDCPPGHSTITGEDHVELIRFETIFERVRDGRAPIVGRLKGVAGLRGLVIRDVDVRDDLERQDDRRRL